MDIYASTLFVGHFLALLAGAPLQSTVLLYLGPETIMPVGSFLAAALGVLLIFWRQTVAIARNSFRRVFVRKSGYSKFSSEMNADDPGQDRTPDRAG
ncbi:MAG TPA: hypothetical protein VFA32_17590 [Dehalococcoidia bacterium]|jgi:hypothetical protein|nr:hypothetical protein [Dehalococcoidia bacterium]